MIAWYVQDGRDLPWRRTRDPYAIFVSEVLLQQTQVSRVLPVYRRFMKRYPTVQKLAAARLREVKGLTDSLGYKVRGRWLWRAARQVAEERAGYFPNRFEELQRLPGVGRSTAGALMSFAYHRDAPILDTNVARVLSRYFGLERPAGGQTRCLWTLAQAVIPPGGAHMVNQGLMDLGAMICIAGAPRCLVCPVRRGCAWRAAALAA